LEIDEEESIHGSGVWRQSIGSGECCVNDG
jgi:hypothetical protein